MSGVDLDSVRTTAAQGWVYGHPMLEIYRTMYAQAIDADDHRYVGGFGTFRHYSQPSRPQNTDVATPNNDSPYSWCWLDLRAQPWVVSVPTMNRYYVLRFHDLDTTYVGFVGARTTGREAGDYLVAGPLWDGEVPEEIAGALRADTQLVGCLGRTYLAGVADADVRELQSIQEQYRLQPLSAYTGQDAPAPAGELDWPVWREEPGTNIEFFTVLDFLLGFFPALPAQKDLRERLAGLGIDGTGTFEPVGLPPEVRAAMEEGIADGRKEVAAVLDSATNASSFFGTREQLGEDYLIRSVAADKGLYGLPAAEAWYGGWVSDDAGNRPPNAAMRDYTIHFAADRLPQARFFGSATLYRLPERLLVDNAADRYSIGDRTPGLVYDGGGLTVHVRNTRPTDPRQAANWLPAPQGPFTVVIRMYGPAPAVLDGRWQLPALTAGS
ncbi:DUF1254 domain-containing protein [Streptomyces uncialis]|uniref:DUF1254 domain-containing protein n=1 Tax=Streptomyces uncialis TaxID=1048205 RepID=UPI00364A445C